MKRVAIVSFLAATAAALLIAFFAPTRTPRAEWNAYTPGERVSLVALIATPERFEGKRVQVIGYVVIEFEGTAIYLHEEDAKRMLTSNGLWLAPDKATGDLVKRRDAAPNYAIVDAVFRSRVKGHMDLWSGALTDITRLEFFPKTISFRFEARQ